MKPCILSKVGISLAMALTGLAAAGTAQAAGRAAQSASKAPAPEAKAGEAEDWKGALLEREWGLGLLGGLGLVEPHYGGAVQGQISKRIIPQGFVPDITNPVFLEASLGPSFVQGHAPFVFSAHLRWDFEKDSQWVLYALGGVGGQISGPELGDRSLIHIRIGAGVFYHLRDNMSLRMEASHELLGVGLGFDF